MKRKDLITVSVAFNVVRSKLEKGINTVEDVQAFANDMQVASALAHKVGIMSFDEHVTLVEACIEMESWKVIPIESQYLFEQIASIPHAAVSAVV